MVNKKSLTDGPIAKSIILFAIPILLSNLFQQLYNSIDTAVVGQYVGPAALAAVGGGTGSLINLMIGFFLGISTGTGVLFAMRFGAGDYPGLKKLIDSALVIAAVSALFISFVGIVFCRQLLEMMGTPDDVIPPAMLYLRIYFAGTLANLIYNVGSGIIQAEGDSTRPLIYLVISGVTNLVLDITLVAVFHAGVAGAAIATIAAQILSAILVVWRLTRLNPAYRLRLLHIRPDWETSKAIIRIAVPCGLQGSMFNISNILVQVKINSFGTVAMAGVTAYTKIDAFSYTSTHALGLAITTFVGQNVGAGYYHRIQKGMRVCLIMSIIIAVTIATLVFVFCYPLLGLFTDDAQAKDIGMQMMHFIIPFTWLLSFNDIMGGAIRGSGQATAVTVIAAVSVCAYRVLWLIIVLHFIHDLRVVFLCYPISWFLNTVSLMVFYFARSKLKRSIRADAAARTA